MKQRILALLLSLVAILVLCACAPQTGPVVFALDLPSSGEDALHADEFLMGAEYAVRWINDNGGINGRILKLEVYDSGGAAAKSESIAAQAAENGSLCLIGGMTTDCSLSSASVCQTQGLPFFSISENADALIQFGSYVCSITPSQTNRARFLCRHLSGSQCVAMLYSNDFDGTQARDSFLTAAAECGLEVLAEAVNPSDYNFGLIIEKLRQTNADTLVIYTSAQAAEELLLMLQHIQWDVPVFFASYDTAEHITDIIGPICEGICAVDYGYAGSDRFKDAAVDSETLLASGCTEGFDTVYYLAQCAQNTAGQLTRAAFLASVSDVDYFHGLNGSLAILPDGTANRDFRLLKYENGGWN